MSDLSLDKLSFMQIMGEYVRKPVFVGMDADDLEEVFNLVTDLLNAEADAIRNAEPYAKSTIREYEAAATTVDIARFDFRDAFEECFPEA